MGKEEEKNPYQLTGLTVHFSRRPRIASDAAAFSPGEVRAKREGRYKEGREGKGEGREEEEKGREEHVYCMSVY